MKVLLLGPHRPNIEACLHHRGEDILRTEEPLSSESALLENVAFIVSYGYRHILKRDLIQRFPKRIINLHISMLPWNRGADPNLWSFLEDTPKGATIHYIDEGLDTGDVLVQQEVDYERNDTLRTSYERLSQTIEDLFMEHWPALRDNRLTAKAQTRKGTSHTLKDREKFTHLLHLGWDTPVRDLIGKALR
ncbi:MAG: formyltransferase family protein [Desulfobacteraceae bacterium]|nr:formyltransferase family protein [Desulfobacteraceae bacterium]